MERVKEGKSLFILSIFVLIILATPAGFVLDNYQSIDETYSETILSYVEHEVIVIENNTDFAYQASLEGWDGDGSSETPYVIEGYNITDNGSCIDIRNVTVHFTIRNCFMNSSSMPMNPGVYLYNASHARIEDSFITWHTLGIDARLCPDIVIDNCTITESITYTINLNDCDGAVLMNNHLFDNHAHVYSKNSDHVLLYHNQIHDNGGSGAFFDNSTFPNFTNNTITNNDKTGFFLQYGCSNATIYDNKIVDNGEYGITTYRSDNATISENNIQNNGHDLSVYGIFIEQTDHFKIADNEIQDNALAGMYIVDSDYGIIEGNSISNNTVWGILMVSYMSSIIDNDIWENGAGGSDNGGIALYESQECVIQDNRIWNNSYSGIYFDEESDFNEIKDNLIFNNNQNGIYAYDSYAINATGNSVWGNGWNPEAPELAGGIFVENCIDWLIDENQVWSNEGNGIYFGGGMSDGIIQNNAIWGNEESGIYLINGGPFVIENCTIYDNGEYGIYANLDDDMNITESLVYDNAIGLEIYAGLNSWIYGNDVGWNSIDNAITNGNSYWHDNVSVGNHWSDYDGQGNYTVTEGLAYDLYPAKSLDLNASSPIAYVLFETGNTMLWEAYALHPSHYEVYANESFLYSEVWDGNDIVANVDDLPAGNNEIMVIAYHISGHSINATAYAEVIDETPPTWSPVPIHQEITVGESFSYRVNATDPSGIGGYSVNDTVNFQISGTGLITNNTNLAVGTYYLEIMVWDVFDNNISQVIMIQVNEVIVTTPTTSTTTTSTSTTTTTSTSTTTTYFIDTSPNTTPITDGTLMIITIVGIGAILAIIVIIVIVKRRSS